MQKAFASSLLLLAACSGGGGGSPPPANNLLQLQVDGVTLPPGASQGAVTVRLAPFPATLRPALLECDVVVEPPHLAVATSRAPLQALQARPTLDGEVRPGGFHVLYGDGENPGAQVLASGSLFAVYLETLSPRAPGDVTVSLRNLRVVDEAGANVPVDRAPVAARVVVQ